MKTTKLNAFSVVLLIGITFLSLTSCEKDEDTSPQGLDPDEIVGDWVIESTDVETTINGMDYYDYQINEKGSTKEEAEFGLLFMSELYSIDGTLTINEDGTYSAIFNDEEESGTWNIGEPNYHLYLNDGKTRFITEVITLTNTKLELREEYEDLTIHLDDTRTEEVSIVTHNLVK